MKSTERRNDKHVTQAEYARAHGVSKSTVSRWKVKGYLKMRGSMVDVAGSDERLRMLGLGRFRERAAERRRNDSADVAPVPESRARFEAARAALAELDLLDRLGETLAVELAEADYEQLLKDFDALTRSGGRYAHLIRCACRDGPAAEEAVERVLLALRSDLREADIRPEHIAAARKRAEKRREKQGEKK